MEFHRNEITGFNRGNEYRQLWCDGSELQACLVCSGVVRVLVVLTVVRVQFLGRFTCTLFYLAQDPGMLIVSDIKLST